MGHYGFKMTAVGKFVCLNLVMFNLVSKSKDWRLIGFNQQWDLCMRYNKMRETRVCLLKSDYDH